MSITLRKDRVQDLTKSIQRYFRDEHEEELTDLRARLLLDFILAEVGPSIYNKAIEDAAQYFQERLQDLDGSCHEIELPYWKNKPGRR
jgi:uncharacterized protein (DUF2164 family)